MRLELLETLILYSRLGTMDAVAREYGCTTAAVVKRIQLLEEEVGQTLTRRVGRGRELTEAGCYLVERSHQILGLVDATVAELQDLEDNPQGTIVIAGRESSAMDSLAPVMSQVRARYPGISFQVTLCGREAATRMIGEGTASFAVLDDSWDCTAWQTLALSGEDRWGLLVRGDSDLVGRGTVRRADITQRSLIMPKERSRELGYWLDKENQLMVVGRYGTSRGARVMVEAGVGEAIVLENMALSGRADTRAGVVTAGVGLVFIPLDWLVGLTCVLAWDKQARLGRVGEIFLEAVRASVAGGSAAGEKLSTES
ncbi:LysR family transcriptional regulator [Actinotignum sp. GS-2025f]|uniref:LysR family transcriptional regulator n=1 Tax=unclassified Actinotignum TaxID=2632702 RepID=UPI002A7FA5A9|nr:LysR family transcriptional regulator [Actinotignum sp. SLA_B059]MDY5127907.1 LysR family transcriptional regulator [Actinotignum sp. SLA_B059]